MPSSKPPASDFFNSLLERALKHVGGDTQLADLGTGKISSWAASRRGVPTTDPEAALAGIIQPMAGHKGYAISVVMDMLSGILTGSGWGPGVFGPYQAEKRSGAGHLLLALNVEVFQPPDAFNARMEAMIDGLKSAPLADGTDEIFYPGEIEARNDARYRREGLTLPDDTLADLARLAGELGLGDFWPGE